MAVLGIWSNSFQPTLNQITIKGKKSRRRELLQPCLKLQRVAMSLSWSSRSSSRTRVVIEGSVEVQEETGVRDKLLRQSVTLNLSLERSRLFSTLQRTTLAKHISRTLTLWMRSSKEPQLINSQSSTQAKLAQGRAVSPSAPTIPRLSQMASKTATFRTSWENTRRITTKAR